MRLESIRRLVGNGKLHTLCWRLCFFSSKAGQTKYFFSGFCASETSYTADNNLELLEFILSVYNRSLENVSFTVCDNKNLNKSIARKMEKPMIGRVHSIYFAVKSTYLKFSEENELLNKLMKNSSTLKQSATLRRKCNLRPIMKNETKWLSILSMLTHYVELMPFIDTKHVELLPYDLTPQKENQIEKYLEDLKFFEFVSKKLQIENNTMEIASFSFLASAQNFHQIIQISQITRNLTEILCFGLTLGLEL